MKYTIRLPLLLAAMTMTAWFAYACGDSNNSNPAIDGDQTTDIEQSPDGDDVDPAELPDVETIEGDGVDVSDNTEESVIGDECRFYADCASADKDCVNGYCVATPKCYESNDECSSQAICYKELGETVGRCRIFCVTDMDCHLDGLCINGVCKPYTGPVLGAALKSGADPKTVLMGNIASVPMDFPMGTSVGGYGARHGGDSPYATKMGSIRGIQDRPYYKALVLDNGTEQLIFVRAPMIFTTEFMNAEIVNKVQQAIGKDITRNLIITSSHTHSMPARFWNILPGLGFGALGLDEFNWETFSRLTTSIANAIIAAEADLKPISIGYAINPDYDPNDLVARDRRKMNNCIDYKDYVEGVTDPNTCPSYKDPRLFMIRVDDVSDAANPKPMVVIMNFAAHGTIEDQVDSDMSQDSGGGAEQMFQRLFEKETGKHIEAMFLQGMAGDVSPAGSRSYKKVELNYGPHGDIDHQLQMQLLGVTLYKLVAKQMYDEIGARMTTDVDMQIATKRLPIDRNYVGYKDGEFVSYDVITMGCELNGFTTDECYNQDSDEMALAGCRSKGIPDQYCLDMCAFETEPYGPLRFGGFQCSLAFKSSDQDPKTRLYDGCLGCLLKVEGLNRAPMPQFGKTRMSALKMNLNFSGGDSQNLVMSILPGEPSSGMGTAYVKLLEEEAEQLTGDDYDAVILGYTNDHHFYLMLEDDYLQGDYNTQMSIWGPKFGSYLLEEGRKLVDALVAGEKVESDPHMKPLYFSPQDSNRDWRTPNPTTPSTIFVTEQPCEDTSGVYQRMTQARFGFIGGDPGVDVPRIILQKRDESSAKAEATFSDYYLNGVRIYDDQLYNIYMTWYNPKLNNPRDSSAIDENQWTITWEDTKDLPLGVYRFKIAGHYYTGDSTADFDESKVEQYTIYTESFTVVGAPLQVNNLKATSSGVTADLTYPSGPTNDLGPDQPLAQLKRQSIILHSDVVPVIIGAPLTEAEIVSISITFSDGMGEASVDENDIITSEGMANRKVVISRTISDTKKDGTPTIEETFRDMGDWPARFVTAPLPSVLSSGVTYTVTVEVEDIYGNTGMGVTTYTAE